MPRERAPEQVKPSHNLTANQRDCYMTNLHWFTHLHSLYLFIYFFYYNFITITLLLFSGSRQSLWKDAEGGTVVLYE